jgi:autotransporter-associated beta strand protein
VVVNGGTLWATTGGNLIGLLTLNGGTVKSTASPPAGKYQGNSFGNATGNYNHAYLSIQLGSNVTVSGTSPSTISGNGTAFTTSQDGISLNGSSTTFTVSNITGDASVSVPDLTIVAAIGDNNADCTPLVSGALVKAGTGMLLLSGLNFYSGGTTVSAGTLVAGTADNQTLPAAGSPMTTAAANAAGAFGRPGTTLTLGDANTTANNSSPTVLIGGAYNVGHPITVANQATTGTYTIGGGADTNAAFTNLITINQPLTISQVANAGANALTISGGITAASGTPMVTFAGPGNINKTTAAIANGSGTVAVSVTDGTNTFSIANTYTGGTTLNGGTLIGPANLGTGGVNFGGGTLQWPASSTADISGQTVTINSGGATLDVNGNTVTLANAIGNGGSSGLTVKSTATNGVLNLSASPTYMGNTTVSSGTLNINSTLANGNVTVANGAAFGGTGSVTHNVTWQSGALASLTQGSALAVSGTVTLNGNLVLVKAGSALTTGTYTLLTTTGGFTGGSTINPYPATGSAIASGYAGTLAISGGSIVLTVNPATTATWSDANHAVDDNWSDAGNWSGGVPQFAGDVATFGSGGPTNPVVLNANESVGSLTFFNPTSYTISGSHTLTLDNRNQGVAITVIAGTANTLASPVALNDNVTATVSATDALTISGTVSNAPSVTKTLTVNGAGTTILPNANT